MKLLRLVCKTSGKFSLASVENELHGFIINIRYLTLTRLVLVFPLAVLAVFLVGRNQLKAIPFLFHSIKAIFEINQQQNTTIKKIE